AQPQPSGGVVGGARHTAYRCGLVVVGRGVFDVGHVQFQASAAAGDGDAVTLPGGVGDQVVAESHAGVVTHQDGHVVLDGDAGGEDVEVAPVSVLVLSLQVQLLQFGAVFHVQGKGVLARFVASVFVLGRQTVAASVLLSVEEQITPGEDFGGPGIDPPIDQVEVVTGLVHEQAAGAGLVPVPAAEVLGAVA